MWIDNIVLIFVDFFSKLKSLHLNVYSYPLK